MRQYELMVILDPELDDRTVQPSLEKFLTVVSKDGGSVDNVDSAVAAWPEIRRSPRASTPSSTSLQSGHGWRAGPPARPQRVGHAHQAPSVRAPERRARDST